MLMIQRIGSLFFGLLLFGLGIVMTIRSGIGAQPWDVLHIGLINYFSLTVGQISQMTGVLVIALGFVLGIKPGWGTIANMYFIGFFIDVFMGCEYIFQPNNLLLQIALLLAGVFVVGWGSFFYLTAAFGSGPRDSFMVGIIQKSGWSLWKVRSGIEATVTLIGFLLGGPVGVGTLIVVFTLGPAIQFVFRIMGKRIQDIKHDGLFINKEACTPQ